MAHHPTTGLILGSGWPRPANLDILHQSVYRQLPDWPEAVHLREDVPGHHGLLIEARLHGQPLWIAEGRLHLYQGYSAQDVTTLVRLLHARGIKRIVLTNAAGSLHPDWQCGGVMLIQDHLNLTGASPLSGACFLDCSNMYETLWRNTILASWQGDLPVYAGVYAGLRGPSYETPAEVRMLQHLGVDAVGMSTVLEALQAHTLGLPVLGVSLLSNLAAGLTSGPLSHSDVLAVGVNQAERLSLYLNHLLTS